MCTVGSSVRHTYAHKLALCTYAITCDQRREQAGVSAEARADGCGCRGCEQCARGLQLAVRVDDDGAAGGVGDEPGQPEADQNVEDLREAAADLACAGVGGRARAVLMMCEHDKWSHPEEQ